MAEEIEKHKHCSTVTILFHTMYSICYAEMKTAEKAPFSQDSGAKTLLLITVA